MYSCIQHNNWWCHINEQIIGTMFELIISIEMNGWQRLNETKRKKITPTTTATVTATVTAAVVETSIHWLYTSSIGVSSCCDEHLMVIWDMRRMQEVDFFHKEFQSNYRLFSHEFFDPMVNRVKNTFLFIFSSIWQFSYSYAKNTQK